MSGRGLVELAQAAANKVQDRTKMSDFLRALDKSIHMKQFDLREEELAKARDCFKKLLVKTSGW